MSGANEAAAADATTTTLPHVFVSYAREDAAALDVLVDKLEALQNQGVLTFWVDDALNDLPGKFGEAIARELARADILVALVSDAWLASKYIKDHEAPAMDRPGMRVVAVLLDGVTWEHAPLFATHHLMFADANEGLGGLLNLEGDALDAAWQKVVRAIANHAREVRREDEPPPPPPPLPPLVESSSRVVTLPPEPLSVADLARRMGTEPFAVGSAAPSQAPLTQPEPPPPPPRWSLAEWARRHGAWAFVVVGALFALPMAGVRTFHSARPASLSGDQPIVADGNIAEHVDGAPAVGPSPRPLPRSVSDQSTGGSSSSGRPSSAGARMPPRPPGSPPSIPSAPATEVSAEPPTDDDATTEPSAACDADRDPHCRRCGARSPQEFIDGVARLAAQNGQADETTYDYEDKFWLYDPSLPSGDRWTSARYRRDLRLARPHGQGTAPLGSHRAPPPGAAWVFIRIPAGEFCMGSPPDEQGRSSHEGPVHRVRITRDFLLAETETTRGQARAARAPIAQASGAASVVGSLTWNEAGAVCSLIEPPRRTERVGLPTEAMWEYAARAGTTTRYSFGDRETALDEHAWFVDNATEAMAAATRPRQTLGLHDIHGNLREWVSDSYTADLRRAQVSRPAPSLSTQLTADRSQTEYVVRGGGWRDSARGVRSASRAPASSGSTEGDIGFRCATLPPGVSSPP